MNIPADKNRRVLVIDDNRAIHEDFRKILCPATAMAAASDATEAAVFGASAEAARQTQFEMDSAHQGQEGVQMVQAALAAGRPYALAFVDVRMPPGWDGLETTRKMWALDPDLQVVFCSAYSDYSWSEMFEKLRHRDGWLILKKPFDGVEALQLAHALTEKWWLHLQSLEKMGELERRVAERTAELRLLSSAVEQARESIVIVDPEADLSAPKILFVNPAFTRLTGYTPEEAIGKTTEILLGPRSDRTVIGRMWKDIDRGEAQEYELIHYRKDGTELNVELQVAPLRNSSGKITHVVAIQHDITARRRAETALRESEARYRALFDGSADGIVIADSETKQFIYANPALCQMLGYTEAEMQTLGVAAIHPPESLPHVMAEFEAQARGDKTLAAALPCLRKDGSVFPADVSATKVTINGRPCNVGFFRDITERKRMEAARLAGERRLHELNVLRELLLHPNPLEEKLKFLTDAVVRIMGADFACVWMIKPGDRCAAGCVHAQVTEGPHVCRLRDRCLHLLASSGRYTHTNGNHGRVPFDCYKIGKIASGEETKFLTNDAVNEPRVHNHAWAKELGLAAFAGYRLVASDGTPMGVLALFSQHAITDQDDLLLEGIAHTTSLVLRSALVEEALRQSEERFRQFADQSSEVIWFAELNPERILFVNRMVEQIWGVPPKHFYQEARTWFKAIHPEDQPRVHEAWKACFQGCLARYEAEYRVVRPDGSIRWVLDGGTPIRNEAGEIVRMSGVARDITERKQAEEALRMFQFATDNAADEIFWLDENAGFYYVNDQACRSLGYTRGEITRLCLFDIDPIFPKERWDETWRNFETGHIETFRTESCHRRKDGSVFPVEVMSKHMRFGGLRLNLAVTRDITERKRLEEQLRASEQRLNEAQRMAQIGSWVWQPDGNLIWSEMMFQLFGIPQQDTAPDFERFLAAIHPDDRERVNAAFLEWLTSGRDADETEYRVLLPDGAIRTIAVIGHLERDADGRTLRAVGTCQDITERQRAENALRMFQLASDNAADSIFWVDPNAGFYYVNDAACRSLGYTREELMRLNLFDIDPFISSEELEAEWKKSRDKKLEALRMESRHQRKDGSSFPIEVVAKRFYFDGADLTLAFVRDMTEHKRAEAELAYERDLLRTLLDQSPDKIYFKDTQSRFIKAGKAHADLFGVAVPEEMVGKTDFDFFTEEHARLAFEDEQEIIRTGVPIIGKVEKEVWQDGRAETWCLTTKMPFRDKDGKIIGTFGVSKDITALKRIENALAYEHDLFRTLMDQSPDSIYFKDLQSRFVRMSRSKVKRFFIAELTRYRADHPEEDLPPHLADEDGFATYLTGKSDFDVFAEAHARPAFDDEQEIIRTGIPLVSKVEKEIWPDGTVTWALTSKMPFRDHDGRIIGTFGLSEDITAMKQAEEQLRQLSRAVEQSSASIVITDPAGSITYVNPKFSAVTGYTLAEALGKNPHILKSGETPSSAYAELWQTITAGREWHGEFHNRKKNGELYWESASISPILDAAGRITHFLAVKEDITERKRMEEQLIQAQKMETVGKLAGGVAHEFNSILTAIIGQAELLIEDLPPGDPLAQNVSEIHHAAERAAGLTRQLLAYGRRQFLRLEALNLNEVIAGMDGMLRNLMGPAGVEVAVMAVPDLYWVKADAGQMEQVIVNLALNARAAMPNGGNFTLETANVFFGPENVERNPEMKPGAYVMVAITDTGIGMSPEVRERVFEPFFTTKGVGQGTGLGLATCYGIIKQSGGHISVHSELGHGTIFKIYLPQAPAEAASARTMAPPALPAGTETILLLGADPMCEMAATLLRRLGYTVLTAGNEAEALSLKLPPANSHIDLLLADIMTPSSNGKEFAGRMRTLYPHTRLLFTSAYAENASIREESADVSFLQKPFTPSALVHKLREVLDRPMP